MISEINVVSPEGRRLRIVRQDDGFEISVNQQRGRVKDPATVVMVKDFFSGQMIPDPASGTMVEVVTDPGLPLVAADLDLAAVLIAGDSLGAATLADLRLLTETNLPKASD